MKNVTILILFIIFSSCNQTKKLTFERIAIQGNNNFYGFRTSKGDTIIPLDKYDFLDSLDIKGMIRTHNNGKEGFIDIYQNIVIPFEYYKVYNFSENLAIVRKQKNGKEGYINRKGELVIGYRFDNAYYFYKCGLAEVENNGKVGFINKKGEIIIPIEYDYVISTKYDDFVVVSKNKKCAIFSGNGKQLTGFEYDKVYKNYDEGWYTLMSNGLMLVEKNGDFSYLNTEYKIIVPFGTYDIAKPFDKNRIAIVGNQEKYGMINEIGKVITPIEYDYISELKNEVYAFEKKSKEGFLNNKGKVIN